MIYCCSKMSVSALLTDPCVKTQHWENFNKKLGFSFADIRWPEPQLLLYSKFLLVTDARFK